MKACTKRKRSFCTVLLLGALTLPVVGQSASLAIRAGDVIGFSVVRTPRAVAIGADGTWVAGAGLIDAHGVAPNVALQQGSVVLSSFQLVPSLSPMALGLLAEVDAFGPGEVVARAPVRLYAFPGIDALLVNLDPLLLAGDPVLAPPAGFAGSAYTSLARVETNDRREILLAASIANGGAPARVLQRLTVDGLHAVTAAETLFYEGGPTPDGAGTIGSLSTRVFDQNDAGDVLVATASGAIDAIYVNDRKVAALGTPSPAPGLSWTGLREARLGASGGVVIAGTVDGLLPMVATEDRVVALSGDPVPAIPGATFHAFTRYNSPEEAPKLTAADEAVFLGATSAGYSLFLEDEELVRAGTTVVQGVPPAMQGFPLRSLRGFQTSEEGRYLLFEAVLADFSEALCVMDLGRVTPLADGGGNLGLLRRARGFALAGQTLTLAFDAGQASGALPYLLVSDATTPGYPGSGGLPLAFGELVIDFGGSNPFLILEGDPWNGAASELELAIQANPALVDQRVYAQGLLFAPGTTEPLRLTNAIEVEIGAP